MESAEVNYYMKNRGIIVSNLFSFLCGSILGGVLMFTYADKVCKQIDMKADKAERYRAILTQWLMLKNRNVSFDKYFIEKGYFSIAIYGYSDLGRRLEEELEQYANINVKYFIDKNARHICETSKIYEVQKNLPAVDVIVVTPICEYSEIAVQLKNIIPYHIISIEDVIYNV